MKRPTLRRLAIAAASLVFATTSIAFVLVELVINVDLDGQEPVVIGLGNPQFPGLPVGLTFSSSVPTNIQGTFDYDPDLGWSANDAVDQGFVLIDGTLHIETQVSDPAARRALRRTYRMSVDPRMFTAPTQRRALRARFIRQGRYTEPADARAAVRAARFADLRIMRRTEGRTGARWVRAVRALERAGGRANIRYLGANDPDGTLGHYGYSEDGQGNPFVWAVMDRNSEYRVGLNVDDDNDGIFNVDDNCRFDPNSDQVDTDTDLLGDACDSDDDNDGVSDPDDNCPLDANPSQADTDTDGMGDACDMDNDNDGVVDGADDCPETPAGETVGPAGCAIVELCPCDNESGWKNHGAFVRCVAHAAGEFLALGLIDEATKDATVSAAAQSSCGAKR